MLKQFLFIFFIITLTTSKNFFFDIPLTKQEQKQLNLKINPSDSIDKIVNLVSKILTLVVERKNDKACVLCQSELN